MKHVVIAILALLLVTSIVSADTIHVSRFTTEGLSGWERKSFKGDTEYRIVKDGDRSVVMAHSNSAASGIYKKIKLDPEQYRYLRWKWKVISPLQNAAEKFKRGDDYAARVYVVFPGFFFWQSKAINYVWASQLEKDEFLPSPYTSNVAIVAIETGGDKAGTWVMEQRDVLADYRRFFGSEPRKIGAIAIMTDTDNTESSATAWYTDITISNLP
jgi:hypothetical protein